MDFFKNFFISSIYITLFLFLLIVVFAGLTFVLRRWVNNKKTDKDQSLLYKDRIEEPARIDSILKAVKKEKSVLKVKLNNRGHSFNSKLLKMEPSIICRLDR